MWFALACAATLAVPGITLPANAQQAPGAGTEIGEFARAWSGINAYSATVTVFEQSGAQTQNVVFGYTFQKPSTVTVHVVAGTNAGVTLSWSGGSNVTARRGSGFAALFKRTLSLHDPLVTTIRGASIDQLSFGSILARTQDQGAQIFGSPGESVDGIPTDGITLITAGSAAQAGLTRQVVELSTATHFPMRILGYDGSALVRKIEFSNVRFGT
jgi:outer membrane lipoprotein-sorting protein